MSNAVWFMSVVVVLRCSHFMKAFAPLVSDGGAASVLYTDDDGEGRATCDPRYFNYTHLTRPLWPMVADPHGEGVEEVPWAGQPHLTRALAAAL